MTVDSDNLVSLFVQTTPSKNRPFKNQYPSLSESTVIFELDMIAGWKKANFFSCNAFKEFRGLGAITFQYLVSKMYFELRVVDLNSTTLRILN